MSRQTVLVVDDEAFVRDSLAEIFESEGFGVRRAESVADARRLLSTDAIDAVVTDLQMPGEDGVGIIADAKKHQDGIPVIVLTGVGTVADAVQAIKAGAFDFLQKPVDADRLLRLVRHATEKKHLVREVRRLRERVKGRDEPQRLAGSSARMQAIRKLIEQVAPTEATVLVTGESGTGKELVAEEIHRQSAVADGALVRVNCAAIPDSLFESEFFGHRRGSFSGAVEDRVGRFAEAEGGTLVLDEIGALGHDMQAKLLRVLEGGEYQVVGESRTRIARARVVAVTNEDLADRARKGSFRADLYYRLAIFPIVVPPLRDHTEDLPAIAEELLRRLHAPTTTLSSEAIDVLASYDWPGNVRELRNVLERAVILNAARCPEAALLRGLVETAAPIAVDEEPTRDPGSDESHYHLRSRLDQLEKEIIQASLKRARGKKKDASRLLGIDPRNFGYYMRKHGLKDGDEADDR